MSDDDLTSVGDRGMNEQDALIFADVMARMYDKAAEKYYSSEAFKSNGGKHFSETIDEGLAWANANRFVNL